MFKTIFSGIGSFFRKRGIALGFWIAKRFGIKAINYKPLAYFLEQTVDPMEDIAKALTDKDPNDGEQIRAILCEDSTLLTRNAIELIRNVATDNINDESALAQTLAILADVEPKLIEKLKCK